MGFRWRIALVAIVAAAVVGGIVPHGIISGAGTATSEVVQAVPSPLASAPVPCADASCGKGAPAPAAPSPGVALAAVLGVLVVTAAVGATLRHRRRRLMALPAGWRDPLFHPPQFS